MPSLSLSFDAPVGGGSVGGASLSDFLPSQSPASFRSASTVDMLPLDGPDMRVEATAAHPTLPSLTSMLTGGAGLSGGGIGFSAYALQSPAPSPVLSPPPQLSPPFAFPTFGASPVSAFGGGYNSGAYSSGPYGSSGGASGSGSAARAVLEGGGALSNMPKSWNAAGVCSHCRTRGTVFATPPRGREPGVLLCWLCCPCLLCGRTGPGGLGVAVCAQGLCGACWNPVIGPRLR
jgi:hypothetical protein